MLFAENKLHSRVLLLAICRSLFLLNLYGNILMVCNIRCCEALESCVERLLIDVSGYSPLLLEYCQTCGQFEVCRKLEDSLLPLLVEHLQLDNLLVTEKVHIKLTTVYTLSPDNVPLI